MTQKMNENVNEVMNVELSTDLQSGITGVGVSAFSNPASTSMYCSVVTDGSMKSKASIYNAINSPDKKLDECLGEVIELKDIIAHEVELVDQNTGEVIRPLRTILVDTKGMTYQAVSVGVANSLTRIFQIFGQPGTWETPIKVKPVKKKTNNGTNMVTLLEIIF